MDRYTEIYRLPERQYSLSCPLMLAAGALLRDNLDDSQVAQFRFRSICDKCIESFRISIRGTDSNGLEAAPFEYCYSGLELRPQNTAGDKIAVRLPENTAVSLEVRTEQVLFSDGSIWKPGSDDSISRIPVQRELSSVLERPEAEMYRKKTSSKSLKEPLVHRDLWLCACGEINPDCEGRCRECREARENIFKYFDPQLLKDEVKKEAEERARIAEEQAEAKIRRDRKLKKIIPIAAGSAAAVILLFVLAVYVIMPSAQVAGMSRVLKNGSHEEIVQEISACHDPEMLQKALEKSGAQPADEGSAAELLRISAAVSDENLDGLVEIIDSGKESQQLVFALAGVRAEAGDAFSQFVVGRCCNNGQGTVTNYKKALEMYTAASEQGNVYATHNLAVMYAYGEGTAVDEYKAFELMTEAAASGDELSLAALGNFYYFGTGTRVNLEKALEYYEMAVEKGNYDAAYNLSLMYLYGEGTAADEKKALELMEKAASTGDDMSELALGDFYYYGYGTAADMDKAYGLYKSSAEKGNGLAKDMLREFDKKS